jgi:hypothetical protein
MFPSQDSCHSVRPGLAVPSTATGTFVLTNRLFCSKNDPTSKEVNAHQPACSGKVVSLECGCGLGQGNEAGSPSRPPSADCFRLRGVKTAQPGTPGELHSIREGQ